MIQPAISRVRKKRMSIDNTKYSMTLTIKAFTLFFLRFLLLLIALEA